MYAVKIWGKDCLPDNYAIISDKEYARYVSFFECELPDMEFSVMGHMVRADVLLQSLRMADKVNNKTATLISRYAGKQRDVFAEVVPAGYKMGHRMRDQDVWSRDPNEQFKLLHLNRLNEKDFNEDDVLYNVFVLCHNPFQESHDFEWILSYKSTVHVDPQGQRYAFINDSPTRDRAYGFATSKDYEFRCEPKDEPKPLLYQGADMGDN
jgi:hypothetical protein